MTDQTTTERTKALEHALGQFIGRPVAAEPTLRELARAKQFGRVRTAHHPAVAASGMEKT